MKKSTTSRRCPTIRKAWRIWAKALGGKEGKNDREADSVAGIRTFILIAYMVTNVAIVANAIRHWNPVPKRELSLGMLLTFEIHEAMEKLGWDLNEYSLEVVPNKKTDRVEIRRVPKPVDGWQTVRKLDSYVDDLLELEQQQQQEDNDQSGSQRNTR